LVYLGFGILNCLLSNLGFFLPERKTVAVGFPPQLIDCFFEQLQVYRMIECLYKRNIKYMKVAKVNLIVVLVLLLFCTVGSLDLDHDLGKCWFEFFA